LFHTSTGKKERATIRKNQVNQAQSQQEGRTMEKKGGFLLEKKEM